MTPAQRTALEALKGSPITSNIDALIAKRDDTAIADILSEGRTQIVSTEIGVGTVLATLAPSGGTFLDTLTTVGQQDANVKWAMVLIDRSSLDIGMPATRQLMQALAQAVPSLADGIAAVLALAVQPAPINVSSVSDALNGVQ